MSKHYIGQNEFNNKKTFILFLFLLLLPIAIPIGSIGHKPIDVTFSDTLIVFSLFFLFFRKIKINIKERNVLVFSFLIYIYILLIGSIGVIVTKGDILPFLSSLRFSKHLLFVFVALVFYKVFKPNFNDVIKFSAYICALFISILLFSDLFLNPGFPTSRWGGVFFGLETYGFPNSIAVFYSLYICFFLIYTYVFKSWFFSLITLIGSVLIFFSFSRSGWVTLLSVLIPIIPYIMLKSKKIMWLYSILIVISVYFFVINFNKFYFLIEPWMYKVDTLTGQNVTLSGRELIWKDTFSLILDRPLLGYFFDPFSNYVMGYDTPHQQYLELIFKMGVLGFLIYFSFVLYLFFCFFYSGYKGVFSFKVTAFTFFMFFLGVSLSNFGQPNLSFSLLANALVFYISLFYFIFRVREV